MKSLLKPFWIPVVFLLSFCMPQNAGAQSPDEPSDAHTSQEWKDPTVFEQHRIYPRTNVVPYEDEEAIERQKYDDSPSYVPFDDTWTVDFTPDYRDRTAEIENDTFAPTTWQSALLPHVQWLNKGRLFSSLPIRNVSDITEKGNATMTYHNTFEAPKDWKQYDVYLQLQSFSAFYVWINHQYIGYCEDSRSLAEFKVSRYLVYGKTNTIDIQVVSTSTGSLLEVNRDPAQNGILNDVALVLKPAANIHDYCIRTTYDPAHRTGTFNIDLVVDCQREKQRLYLEVELFSPDGKRFNKMGKWVLFEKRHELTISLKRDFTDVLPWTAETPNLYTAVIRVNDDEMNPIESLGTLVGFRTVQIHNGMMLVNDKMITLRGVIYADHRQGELPGAQRARYAQELSLMKANNINAVRTAVFSPASPIFYEMCDRYGIYVICDANINPLSNSQKALAADAAYSDLFVTRVQNMYEQHKNHPSIICWSLGDERGNGTCMNSAYQRLKALDPTRPVIFSGARAAENTDIIAYSPATLDEVKQFASKVQSRPLILMSYGSTQGNGFGGLDPMWQFVRDRSNIQGGFAAYWNSFTHTDVATGNVVEEVGFVDSLLRPTPLLAELKEMYRSFDVKGSLITTDGGEFRITNLADFDNDGAQVFEYEIYTNLKKSISSGEFFTNLGPGETKAKRLKVPKINLYAGEELFVRFYLKQKQKRFGIPAGTELGSVTYKIPATVSSRRPLPDYERIPLTVSPRFASDAEKTLESVTASNENFSITVDCKKGLITSYKFHGTDMLLEPLQLDFWRPPTDNDRADPRGFSEWAVADPANITFTPNEVSLNMGDGYSFSLDLMSTIAGKQGQHLFDVRQTLLVMYSGDVVLSNDIVCSDQVRSLPAVGLRTLLPKQLAVAEWYGMSTESYADRCLSGRVIKNTDSVDNLFFRYAKPQAAGNRSQVRWTSFSDGNVGIEFDMLDTNFNFSIYPYTDAQLALGHPFEGMSEGKGNTLKLHYRHAGAGAALAGVNLQDPARVAEPKYGFVLHFSGYDCNQTDPIDFARVAYPNVRSNVLAAPVISASADRFDHPMDITLSSPDQGVAIHYTLDGSRPTLNSPLYTAPFAIGNSVIVKARAFKDDQSSFVTDRRFDFDYIQEVRFDTKPKPPYNRNAKAALSDGFEGEVSDLQTGWLGFQGGKFNIDVTLGKTIEVEALTLRFAHNPEAWIFAPMDVNVSVSVDGVKYSAPIPAKLSFDPADESRNSATVMVLRVPVSLAAKYIRIEVQPLPEIPEWHRFKRLNPWLMTDEIKISEKMKK